MNEKDKDKEITPATFHHPLVELASSILDRLLLDSSPRDN